MKINDLKEGDKLYSLVYWNSPFKETSERQMRQVTVKKVKNRRAYLKGGYWWTVTERMFNSEWFPSKLEAYKFALDEHKEELEKLEYECNRFRKEVKYLNKKIKELE